MSHLIGRRGGSRETYPSPNAVGNAVAAFQNRGTVGTPPSGALNTIDPNTLELVAAANVTRTASGLFMVGVSYAAGPAPIGTFALAINQVSITTAWLNGQLSVDGTWRIDTGTAAIVATGSGPSFVVAAESQALAGINQFAMSLMTECDFSGSPVGSQNLITVTVANSSLTDALTSAGLGKTFFYELP